MARKRKKRERQQRLHQEPIVRRVADILQTGEPTRWRWSSACRHGLRSAYCFKGWSWEKADQHAASIVRLAALRIGLEIPSWIVAQGEPPQETTYYFCAGCGGHMRDGNDRPWCSPECNKLSYKRRYAAGGGYDDAFHRAAVGEILGGAEPRLSAPRWHCSHCREPFEPDRSRRTGDRRQKYCSPRCAQQAKQLAYRDCLMCASPFQARSAGRPQLFCSRPCKHHHAKRQEKAERQRPPRPCTHCGTMFEPPQKRGRERRWCSDACRSASYRQRRAEDEAGRPSTTASAASDLRLAA